jgi:hypothetical protein
MFRLETGRTVRAELRDSPPMASRYVMINGQGRSGTNWLHEILDYSPWTHCRNELNTTPGTAFATLPSGWLPNVDLNQDGAWDNALREAQHSFSFKDPLLHVRKQHLHGWSQRLKLVRIMQGRRCRRVLGYVIPALHRPQWPVPWWVSSAENMERALLVVKINQGPGWADWVLKNDPRGRVLHIVRHPGGFLNSYMTRWLQHAEDREAVLATNRRRLETVAAGMPRWADRFGDISAMSLLETELWFWCYCAETFYEIGHQSPAYRRIIYENLVRDTVAIARSIYEWCDLPWEPSIERAIGSSSEKSGSIAAAWRDKLQSDQVELIDKILDTSFLRDWWPEASGHPVAAASGCVSVPC